jgi:hypothetical protein
MTEDNPNAEALRTGRVRTMKRSDLAKCPHLIILPSHYRDDGSCRCNDRKHTEMKEWGYKWKDGQWR